METVRMKAPEGAQSCSHNSVVYTVEQGFVRVLPAAVEALTSFGYRVDADAAEEAEKLAKSDAQVKTAADAAAKEAEDKRLADEVEAKRVADEAEAKRVADEAEARRKAEEEAAAGGKKNKVRE